VLVAWSGTRPLSRLIRLDEPIVLGRNLLGETNDDRISREHVRITAQLQVTDLGSRNGTQVGGVKLETQIETPAPPLSVLRAGRTVGVLIPDIEAFDVPVESPIPGTVAGRRTTKLHAALAQAARDAAHVVLVGDPGCGRGHLARAYAKLLAPAPTRIEKDPFLDADGVTTLIDTLACTPDLRLIATQNRFAGAFKRPLDEFLQHNARCLEVPPLVERADEVASLIAGIVGSPCSGSVLEYCLLHAHDNLGYLMRNVRSLGAGDRLVGVDDLLTRMRAGWIVVGKTRRRR
jgi:hypothetical protein